MRAPARHEDNKKFFAAVAKTHAIMCYTIYYASQYRILLGR